VLARVLALEGDPRQPPAARVVDAVAARLLPPGTAAVHNQAVMELGALVCTPRSPACSGCPLEAVCAARAEGIPEAYPQRVPKRAVPHVDVAVGVIVEAGRVFIDQRPYDGMLGGLWEFPGGKVEPGESVEAAVARELFEEFGLEIEVGAPLPAVQHAYTHLRVTLHPYLCRYRGMAAGVGEGMAWRWVRPAELDDYAMPRANRRIVELLRAALATGGAP
jgi:A/G-specific adenine glycosylase